jgi:hypothetical protein
VKFRELNFRIVSVTPFYTARRNDRCETASIRESSVEDGFGLGNVLPEPASNILHGDHEGLFTEWQPPNLLEEPIFLYEDSFGTINHDLRDSVIEDQVLNGLGAAVSDLIVLRL